ncbi:cyclophilin [Hahella sp. CCB-MM4]|uniref:peptidylprolyl isomerase n=1 Tax=Hahella sp. (strain CCB-MM4) TaxID=1926491 RepID=UPI000B9A5B6C|nr:peptidylprolyl isomerase [Hahella sp. CCB-MM4]OZG71234.1 cyclophilin [Hahella sp. CCB-MM4]
MNKFLIAVTLFITCCISTYTQAQGPLTALVKTNQGIIKLQLDPEKAPETVDNFLKYANSGFYDGTVFHRTIKDFMIQGGGFDQQLAQKPTSPPVKNESSNGLSNVRGTVAMARTSAPNSATSQFFINVVDNLYLDYQNGRSGYTVFGKVVEGMEVVDKIANTPTVRKGAFTDLPEVPIVIETVVVDQSS